MLSKEFLQFIVIVDGFLSADLHSFLSICSIGLARETNGVTSAKSTYQTILLALEIMNLVRVTRMLLPRSSLICEKTELLRRRKKRKQNVPSCKLKQ